MTGKALPMVVEPNIFKKIAAVPNEKDLIDSLFSEQQRRTPTFLHTESLPPSLLLRQSYVRKVKHAHLYFSSKLSKIAHDFPRLNYIHPLYAGLLRAEDRYDVALARINNARLLIADISEEHLKFMTEYCGVGGAPTPLRTCRSLCVSAVGRMCTVVRRLGPSLAYLEETRLHMAGLPSIDPDAPTMVLVGSPNDAKRSFMRQMAGGDHVDYWHAFYVARVAGMDQVINTVASIDLKTTSALARLRCACVLFFLDLSDDVRRQAALFRNVKSVFVDKPFVVVVHRNVEGLSEVEMVLVREMTSPEALAPSSSGGGTGNDGRKMGMAMVMGTVDEKSMMRVKEVACEQLQELKMKADGYSRLNVAMPNEAAEVRTVWNMPTGRFQLGARKDNVHGCHIDTDIMLRLLELECGEGEIIKQAEAEEEGDMRRSVGRLVPRL
ncbi:unnamed protein product [Linum tenue]|uniref:Uncharacterized protein n=1 Tax=Linum tenue TaxID=586396 RepID=A0AAV0HCJ1_9ROSI|nr:unnamed protein product [Linum tenue]